MKCYSKLIIDPSVGTANEQRARQLAKERLPGKTTTSLLHRLKTAVENDQIVVMDMDDGRR